MIWSAVLHFIERAVTAPFTLIVNAFGGDESAAHAAEHLRYIAFSPGSSALTVATRKKLDTMAKLLMDKPEVKLELTGHVDPAIDTSGLSLAYVDEMVKKEKAQALARQGQKATYRP
ncbi:hypothetical protein [Paraburkholderia terrae]|uniref:DUF748 domain-containing protein n=1 Tax=Paraburkholderia terrae TaxID=311230 RepID=UPI00206268E8|nr:hypothetical protein [Paraburkholderia terrae]BDC45050.1 hypothetical protein PTKU15_83470 [Paraburkholderia terrae]